MNRYFTSGTLVKDRESPTRQRIDGTLPNHYPVVEVFENVATCFSNKDAEAICKALNKYEKELYEAT